MIRRIFPALFLVLFLAASARADLSLEGTAPAEFATEETFSPGSTEWKILKPEWNEADERRFSEFVQAIGRSGCRTTDQCLKSDANPFRTTDPAGLKFYSDCADLPYYLRAYFAWKNGLPFVYTSSVTAVPTAVPSPSPSASPVPARDIRYSSLGNRPASRVSILTKTSNAGDSVRIDGWKALRSLLDRVSTATFRIGPNADQGRVPSDLYPTKIDRASIRPGTAIYDPAGHVAVVYQVEPDGRILFIDAHPDNSITRGTFGKKFVRSTPGHGAGFKNWRPVKIVDAVQAPHGEWLGGRIVSTPNREIGDYSIVQYYGTDPDPKGSWKKGRFVFGGQSLDFHDFLRRALSEGELRYDPLREFGLLLRGLCVDLQDRATAVDLAIRNGIATKVHPERLPTNIYGSTGEWEDYATPSRDARLKTSAKEAHDRAAQFLELWRAGDPSIQYSGSDLRKDLGSVFAQESAACRITYARSNGAPQTLELAAILDRVFDLSFDPYHCAELRWGATAAEELASCPADADKQRWHRALRRLRNQLDRTYDARMDYTAAELEDPRTGGALGVANPPAIDFEALLGL